MQALYSLVGKAVTLEILLEGRVFGAAEALQKGLVTRVVADAQVVEKQTGYDLGPIGWKRLAAEGGPDAVADMAMAVLGS